MQPVTLHSEVARPQHWVEGDLDSTCEGSVCTEEQT
jgi:hypothetical protein